MDNIGMEEFLRREHEQGQRLRQALIDRRYDRDLIHSPRHELRSLSTPMRCLLGFSNPYARVDWIRTFADVVCNHLGAEAPDYIPRRPVFLLTLVGQPRLKSRSQYQGYEEEDELTVSQRQWRYRSHLHFLDYIGTMEPAFYAYLPPQLRMRPHVEWHFHGLVWGVTDSELQGRCARIRKELQSFLPGATAADARPVESRDLRQIIWYVNKAPREQLSVSRKLQQTRNRYSYRQGSGQLSGVNRVRLYASTRDLYIDHLSLAGGQGSALLEEIKQRTLRPFRKARRAGKVFT